MDVEDYTNLKYSMPILKNSTSKLFCAVYYICYVGYSGYGPIYVCLSLLHVAHLGSIASESNIHYKS